jgi:hypothetical protein
MFVACTIIFYYGMPPNTTFSEINPNSKSNKYFVALSANQLSFPSPTDLWSPRDTVSGDTPSAIAFAHHSNFVENYYSATRLQIYGALSFFSSHEIIK